MQPLLKLSPATVEKGPPRAAGRRCYGCKGSEDLMANRDCAATDILLLQDAMLAFCTRAGADNPGGTEMYVFCRILGAIINEAGLALADGVAGGGDIDTAMVKGTNYPKGPLAWADEIGHRTVRGLLKGLGGAVSDGRYEPAPLFAQAE